MLERAKANGLIVQLNGYKVHIYGASPAGITPQVWATVKNFWTLYFSAAGVNWFLTQQRVMRSADQGRSRDFNCSAMKQAESNSDSPKFFTRKKWFAELDMAACGIALYLVRQFQTGYQRLCVHGAPD